MDEKRGKTRERLAWGLALLALSLIAGWLLRGEATPQATRAPARSVTQQTLLGVARPAQTAGGPPVEAAPQAGAEEVARAREPMVVTQAALIGAVSVDKRELCPHEDALISIAPTPDAPGAAFNIEGKFGREIVVSPSLPEQESFWIVAAEGDRRDFREVTLAVLPAQHPRCARAPLAEIVATPDAWSRDELHFEVVALNNLQDLAQVEWSFGDGHVESGGARTSHSYGGRPQRSATSAFVVSAEITDSDGQSARARTSVSLPNLHYQARMLSGYRSLPVEYDRFAAVRDSAEVRLRLNNLEARPVRFEHATVRLRGCNGVVREEQLAASELLSAPELPAEQVVERALVLAPAWTQPGICRISLTLTGDTVPPTTGVRDDESGLPNRPLTTTMTFELGIPKSAEQGGDPEYAGRPITDPELEARLLQVMQKLGTNYLSQEQLDGAAP